MRVCVDNARSKNIMGTHVVLRQQNAFLNDDNYNKPIISKFQGLFFFLMSQMFLCGTEHIQSACLCPFECLIQILRWVN